MSRKLILSLAALGTLASVALIAGSANAKAPHGNGNHPGNHPGMHINHPHHHQHVHFRRIHGHYYLRPVGYVARVSEPGPCTCLWKGYTSEGAVVFKDLCTQEMVSAPVEGAPAQASEVQAPGNFAGKTYKDYMAANPQAQKN